MRRSSSSICTVPNGVSPALTIVRLPKVRRVPSMICVFKSESKFCR